MRVLRFPAYERNGSRAGAVQARAWIILWSAVSNYPSGNREQSQVGHQLYLALRGASEELSEIPDARGLCTTGADVYLEDAEFRLARNAVEKIRDQVPLGNVDALLYVDMLLDKAPEIAKEAYKNGQRLD